MRNFTKSAATVMSVITAICLTVGTFAVFTDRFAAKTSVTAGTLDISLTQQWNTDNATVMETFKPGTALKLNYTLTNKGNMASDVREIFVITSEKELSTGSDREFDLYAAGTGITVDADGNVTALTATPLTPFASSYTKDDKTLYTLTYSLDQITLAASGDSADGDTYTTTYYVVFNQNVDNSFQNVGVGIDYMAQALQDSNTGENTWTAYANDSEHTISEGIIFGGNDMNVVPKLNDN